MLINKTPAQRFLFSLVLLCIEISSINAQQSLTVRDSIYSSVLQEERKIELIFPKGYKPDSPEKYEVLYCLEGISNFTQLEYNFLSGEGFIPDLILVGLPNTEKNGVSMRDRDFTPTHTYGDTGGAGKFLLFLKNELIPYMQKRYPVKSSGHSLYGGSMSGLFAVYAFLADPDLFTSYIAVDPSLWWDNFYLQRSFDQFMPKPGKLRNTLWLAGREGSAFQYMGIAKMDSILSSRKLAGLSWKRQLYPNETHYSTQFKGLWDGLKFSYGGFYASTGGYITSRQIMIKPQRGLVVKDASFDLICYNLGNNPYIRYTTDGTEPTINSPSLTGEQTRISLNKTSLVRVKSFCVRDEYNKEDSAFFEVGNVIKSIKKPTGIKAGGLHFAYYEGGWDTIPDMSQLSPSRQGQADKDFDLSAFPTQPGYALSMDGYIKIENPGYYVFEMGGGNFRVFLNDRLILGDHIISGIGQEFLVPLEKGFYPLRIQYLHTKGANSPQPLYLKPEGMEDFPVPSGMLYSR